MIGRVTSQQIYQSSQQRISTAKVRLSQLQDESSSGSRITKPSDDPTAAAAALQVRAQQRATAQYGTNIADGLGWLATVDASLTSSENALRQAVDLTVQGANGATLSPASREALATQLDGLKADLLGQANTKYLGRTVFAGNSDSGAAFDGTTYAYSGASGSTVDRRVSATETVPVSADGAAAYGTGSSSVFATIDSISAALRSGDQAAVTNGLTALQTATTRLSAEHAVVGAHYARLQQAKTENGNTSTALETQRSGIEDADAAQVLIDLKSQELTYQTALAVTAQSLQQTLMNYLR
ncbi:flagellar hook-associated protein FlgL [Amnibacterium sp. CER49]|uniref:flagellar hook-associated protein FlgL n=1 Tax=Amnibacterium sp. CER49 TaxID=3039161 RepID=UPI00244C7E81|nr:flagellar hook-associated protein FlgL [Amnibacterium sp. CER49]MDH2443841.1 flagellar hook-associated protein FlgL [Amnibacterium sp. CER49]